jgi:hypothetical protein
MEGRIKKLWSYGFFSIEQYAMIKSLIDDEQVLFATTYMRGYVTSWWIDFSKNGIIIMKMG